jgi:hypothetical protein
MVSNNTNAATETPIIILKYISADNAKRIKIVATTKAE